MREILCNIQLLGHFIVTWSVMSRPEVILHFSCSTQLSTKFKQLIKTEILTNYEVSCFKSLRCCIYHANIYYNANNCWHFNIYKQGEFRAQLS